MRLRRLALAARQWWRLPSRRERVLTVLAQAERAGEHWLAGATIAERAHAWPSAALTLAKLERDGLVVSREAPDLDFTVRGRVLHRPRYRIWWGASP